MKVFFYKLYYLGVEIVFFSSSVEERKKVVVNKPFIFNVQVIIIGWEIREIV